MKKLVLMLAVAFSVSLVSCGNNEAAQTEEAPVVEEVAVEEVAEVVPDSVEAVADSVATEVAPEAAAE